MALEPDPNSTPNTNPVAQHGQLSQRYGVGQLHPAQEPSNLADILERVLDKGIVIAGDIQLNLLDIELITIKIRLLIASVDRAREMGINWRMRESLRKSESQTRTPKMMGKMKLS